MSPARRKLEGKFLQQARHSILKHHLPRIAGCLGRLRQDQIWWKPNEASNSIGNLALHLEGNVRQWILAGLGGAPDRRERWKEFAERGPIPRKLLLARLERTVRQAARLISTLPHGELDRPHNIQGFRVSGFKAIAHVVEHFAYHTGQIIFAAKMLEGRDLGFTRLPGEKRQRRFPAI